MSLSPADGSLRVAIAGYGLAGRVFHAALVGATDGLEVAAVVTNDPDKRAALADEHPDARAVDRLDDALVDADLVVIASPNRFHAELAAQAIDAGRHVVVDKPLAVTAAQARKLDARATERGVVLAAFHNRRWDDDFLTLRREVAAGRLGDVLTLVSRFDRWRPEPKANAWRENADPADGGGLLLDLGSHLVDQAIQLLGPVSHVYAELDTTRPKAQVEDEVFLSLTHATGARSHLHAGVHAADGPPRFRALGTEGAYVVSGLDPQESQLRAGMRPDDPAFGHRAPGDAATFHDGSGTSERLAMERGDWPAFYAGVRDAIREGAPPPVPAADAIAVLDVLEAARASARGGTVVALG
ncbi:MAG TPA: Gfo/Idh/MocA family oxidoreductase [Baekduia sp.]|uniref:Gfo/Idh/MocA family protein n=1 Tax=Baekduia sp. TaxID=2600305 RepID=UPI002D7907FF|nr:Gfo/Idh/MocA family oxidoreductase [Baekduia sp.]HET6507678.1 Gfo/Idh/MocA family oxidoreductase [Baekduia sp.]